LLGTRVCGFSDAMENVPPVEAGALAGALAAPLADELAAELAAVLAELELLELVLEPPQAVRTIAAAAVTAAAAATRRRVNMKPP